MRNSRIPTVETHTDHSASGLTLTRTVSRTMQFTIAQLKYGCTADKLLGVPYIRDEALTMLSSLVRKNRWELFGTFEGYRIITNGYGQFKQVEFDYEQPVNNAETIFNKLEQLLDL